MRNKGFILILAIFTLLYTAQLAEASGRKLGTAGAAQLQIPMGAKGVAIAGSNISSVAGTDAIFWNPAGLAMMNATEANFNYLSYFADMSISYITVGTKIGASNAIGASLQILNVGDIDVTTINNPEGTGQVLSPTFFTAGLTYSRQMTDRINFGINAKLVYEKINNMSAQAVAFDFGLQYITPWGIELGVILKDIGSEIQYSGSDAEFNSEIPFANPNATTRKTKLDMASHELPTSFGLGLGYTFDIAQSQALTASGVYLNNSYNNDNLNVGAEYNLNNLLFGRLGYTMALFDSDYPDEEKEYQYGLTAGLGVQLLVGGAALKFDYAYRPMSLLDANHYFNVGFAF